MTGETASNGLDGRQTSIEGALRWFADEHITENENATVLAYTPRTCRFLRFKGVTERGVDFDYGPAGQFGFNLDEVFELRGFTTEAEVRWLRTGATGRFVVVSHAALTDRGFTALVDKAGYVLWGAVVKTTTCDGGLWAQAAEPRIGHIWVPLTTPIADELVRRLSEETGTKRRWLRLIAQEYIAVGPHGNVTVAEERLLRIEVYDGEGPRP